MTKEIDYQGLKVELDGILDELQALDGDIDMAVAKYERGMEILKQLEDYLKTADNKVKKIKADFSRADG